MTTTSIIIFSVALAATGILIYRYLEFLPPFDKGTDRVLRNNKKVNKE